MSRVEGEADRLVRYLGQHPGATLAAALLDASAAGNIQGAVYALLSYEQAGFIRSEPQTTLHLTQLGRELASGLGE